MYVLVCGSMYLGYDRAHAIAQHQVWHVYASVVDGGLVQDLLCEVYGRCFELNEHQCLHLSVVDDGVAAFFHACHFDGHFHGYEVVWVVVVFHQQLQGRLAHQFLGRKADVSPPPRT